MSEDNSHLFAGEGEAVHRMGTSNFLCRRAGNDAHSFLTQPEFTLAI